MEKPWFPSRTRDRGIPEHLRGDIWKAFKRFGGSARGAGLGLAIVRQLVELQGGRVLLSQPEDGGSRFMVRLPKGGDSRVGPWLRS